MKKIKIRHVNETPISFIYLNIYVIRMLHMINQIVKGAQWAKSQKKAHRGHLTNFQAFPGLEIFTAFQLDNLCTHLHFFLGYLEINTIFLRFKVSCISFVYVLFYVKQEINM